MANPQLTLKTPFVLAVTAFIGFAAPPPAFAESAAEIIEASGVKGGIVVHLGCGTGELTADLLVNDHFQVQGLDRDGANVEAAREHISNRGLYGDVSAGRLSGDQLPYVDNFINLVVAEDSSGIDRDEIMRVLAPNGVAYLKEGDNWTKTVKPRPENIDEWTHYLHDASGNAVAHDDVVGPPRHLQWLGSPRWSRHHDRVSSINAVVTANGRMFYIDDEGSRISIQLPSKWTLVARDAFNGTILWKKPLDTWHNPLWPLKSGSTQMARRLIAVGDRVYVTLGMGAPLSALDAATGEVITTYDGAAVEEAIYSEGTLFILDNPGEWELADYAPKLNTGDQARVKQEYSWNQKPRQLTAVDAESGRVLWKKETKSAPLTLSADPVGVFFHDGERVQALDRDSGETMWSSETTTQRTVFNMNFGPKLVLHGDIVLFAGGDGKMRGLSARTGKTVWEAPHGQSGYQSPEDILVSDGIVWNAPTTSGKDSGVFTGRNPSTGEVVREFPPDVETYWFHHRCYIAKATDNFLLTSRTGIEFVDTEKQTWDINHWVRGSCLYGIMPANGMVYAPPHNCACYPETKLYGINALAPAAETRLFDESKVAHNRLERGPAYGDSSLKSQVSSLATDWPTYRHDNARSGFTRQSISSNLKKSWQSDLGGDLTALSVAGGRLYVAQPDTHSVHALDAASGEKLWSYTSGARVDSPPTIDGGSVFFGSTDGYVYCLRASDGALAWRFRAAPIDRRMAAFEQIESVWPVHGSVLVQNGVVTAVAGRSNFLDGGLRVCRIDAVTGELIDEKFIDEKNPDTGNNIQEKIAILQMPVGLPDILSSDGEYVYMRSQRFDLEGNREEIGPVSGEFAVQGGSHQGVGQHLFAPMGFLDDTWFHRSYWVYGKNFAGGHGGYYQAGKYAPAGRILVFDDDNVYGFARKPEYLKWTTTIEHQLFAASREMPVVDDKAARRGATATVVEFANTRSLDPSNQGVAVEAWIKADEPDGVVLVRGGPAIGYGLIIKDGNPSFFLRSSTEKITAATGTKKVPLGKWIHLAGALANDGELRLFVNGEVAAKATAPGLLEKAPAQPMEIGADTDSIVGKYKKGFSFTGTIDEVKLHHGDFSAGEIEAHFAAAAGTAPKGGSTVLSLSFDDGSGKDASGFENNGEVIGANTSKGKTGDGLLFAAKPNRQGGSMVKHFWDKDLPLIVRSMVLADKTIFVAGPPDLIDEEETFVRLTQKDDTVEALLAEQDAAFEGAQGGILRAINAVNGEELGNLKLDGLPVWDSMIAANGKLYFSTTDGRVQCLEGSEVTASADN